MTLQYKYEDCKPRVVALNAVLKSAYNDPPPTDEEYVNIYRNAAAGTNIKCYDEKHIQTFLDDFKKVIRKEKKGIDQDFQDLRGLFEETDPKYIDENTLIWRNEITRIETMCMEQMSRGGSAKKRPPRRSTRRRSTRRHRNRRRRTARK
jgi:hypothetical protein